MKQEKPKAGRKEYIVATIVSLVLALILFWLTIHFVISGMKNDGF